MNEEDLMPSEDEQLVASALDMMSGSNTQRQQEIDAAAVPTPERLAIEAEIQRQEEEKEEVPEEDLNLIELTGKNFKEHIQTKVPIIGDIIQPLEPEERMAQIESDIEAKRESGDNTRFIDETLLAAEKGAEDQLMLPLTVAAAVTRSATDSWSDPPEILKASPLGQIVYEIVQLAPLGALGVGTGLKTKASLAAIETATQDSIDEVVMGPALAEQLGRLWSQMSGDQDAGIALATKLANGETLEGQAFVKVVGFLQNLGFNYSEDALRFLANPRSVAMKDMVDAAEALGKDVDEVRASINNTKVRPNDRRYEPTENARPDDAAGAGVSQAAEGKVINEDAFVAENVKLPTGEASVIEQITARGTKRVKVPKTKQPNVDPDAPSHFFFNQDVFSEEAAAQGIEEVASTMNAMDDASWQLGRLIDRGARWAYLNQPLLDTNQFGEFYKQLMKESRDLPKWMQDKLYRATTSKAPIPEKLMNKRFLEDDALAAVTLILENQGKRIYDAANVLAQLRNSNIPTNDYYQSFRELITNIQPLVKVWGNSNRVDSIRMRVRQKDATEEVARRAEAIKKAVETGDVKASDDITISNIIDLGLFNKIFDGAEAGDPVMQKLLDQVVAQMAFADDPSEILTKLKFYGDSLGEARKRANSEAASSLWFAGMLSRAATNAVAAMGGIFNLTLKPLSSYLNVGKSMVFPGVNVNWTRRQRAAQNFAFANGQVMGGLNTAQYGLKMFVKSYKKGVSANAGFRFQSSANPTPLMKRAQQYKTLWESTKKRLDYDQASDGEYVAEYISHLFRMMSTNPFIHYGVRGLLAQDDMVKTIRGGQLAGGMAAVDALEMQQYGAKKGRYEALFKSNMDKIFMEGMQTGAINPESAMGQFALDSGKYVTFQRDIPDKDNRGVIGGIFAALDAGSKEDPIFKYLNPFVRIGWDTSEQTFNNMPIVGEAITRSLNKDAREIIRKGKDPNASVVDKAKLLELESNFAFAQIMALTGVMYGSMGLLNGRMTNGQVPPMSANVEWDGQNYAVDLSRLEPAAPWLFFAVDLQQSYAQGKISRGEYAAGIAELISSMGSMTLQRQFNEGLQNVSTVLDIANWDPKNMSSLVGVLFGGPAPAIGRGVGTIVSPTKDISYGPGERNAFRNVFNVLGQRYTATNAFFEKEAKDYWPITGEIKMRVPTPPNANPGVWERTIATIMEFSPVRIVNSQDPNHPTIKKMNEHGLELPDSAFRYWQGIQLSPDETSMLKKEFSTVGAFNQEFNKWIEEPAQRALIRELENEEISPKSFFGSFDYDNDPRMKRYQQLRNNFALLVERVKDHTIRFGSLKDSELIKLLQEKNSSNQQSSTSNRYKGTYQTAAELAALSQLPTELQPLLDIA